MADHVLPDAMTWDFMTGLTTIPRLLTDSTVFLSTGTTVSNMRHIKKTQRIHTAWLSDVTSEGWLEAYKIPSGENLADIGMKPLDGQTFMRLRRNIGVLNPETEFSGMPCSSFARRSH